MLTAKDTTRIRTLIVRWYRTHHRPFPWRVAHPDPYLIFVSEVMLQQTQAARVAELLPVFLRRFPDVEALARAGNAEVIQAWKGLGYNNRALRLRNAARIIVDEHDGVVPKDQEALLALPGLGPYASASITTFAYDTRTVVLDVNIRRVFSRLIEGPGKSTGVSKNSTLSNGDSTTLSDGELHEIALQLLPVRASASEWYNAVMELGATVCQARSAKCDVCPVRKACASAQNVGSMTSPKKKEPEFRNEPRRLWRGRVVQVLREHPAGLHRRVAVRLVFGSTTSEELRFVDDLLARLTKDGLVAVDEAQIIRLPH